MQKEIPEIGEVVVCKISKILDYGVFAELLEYEGLNGFVHISQVASSWVKNIRNFVKENQIRAAQVTHVDFAKGQIDLSFTKVSAGAQRAKIDSWKFLKRNQKLLEILAKEKKSSFETVWKEVAEPLMQNYDSLQEAFQQIAFKGKEAAKGVPEKWQQSLVELMKKSVEVPKRTVRGIVAVSCPKPDGAELIKHALIKARNSGKDASVELYYVGSGKWDLRVSSFDFKVAERVLATVSESLAGFLKAAGGSASVQRLD
ncbi:MAG: translation initiation factor IF-2 subunit alpha [Candidatus Diapherotrites archaeon]|uniref:Translation initiation factor IF-2 subunit alpha n=1 Tax=Candidatus Iainarchaeum sp. TaxID=3101447 RepID=A0A7J4KUG5_9ARCH|nr:translation initiation factor IF-2 subunit alpha [Candidatus Diapherotrites archaeon]HIH33448.1 translation initiation factor IF-2 subunit alpha [Candidatus Diapherotrites archaeon]